MLIEVNEMVAGLKSSDVATTLGVMDEVLTTAEAGKVLGVNSSRVRQLCIAGEIEAKKLGPLWMITSEAVERYRIQAQKRPKGRPEKLKS